MMRGASPRSVAELLGHQITQDDDALRATCRRPACPPRWASSIRLRCPSQIEKGNVPRRGIRVGRKTIVGTTSLGAPRSHLNDSSAPSAYRVFGSARVCSPDRGHRDAHAGVGSGTRPRKSRWTQARDRSGQSRWRRPRHCPPARGRRRWCQVTTIASLNTWYV
jgi:hypothetical protein